jgi:Uma2 family endonuclease
VEKIMVEQLLIKTEDLEDCSVPDANLLVTEDDTPVDNFASEKQQRLLVGSLYSSLQQQQFLAAANVAIFHKDTEPAIVPDIFVSFDVQVPENWWEKQNRCYLVWKFGKVPEIVIELVSNREGEELGKKLATYEQMRVSYYIVYDPQQKLGNEVLQVYKLHTRRYEKTSETWLAEVGLGLTIWSGEFEGRQDNWLRWCDQEGNILLTGDEKAELEKQRAQSAEERAQSAEERAQSAEERAQSAEERAQLLAQKLRELGIDPNHL